MMNEQVQIAGDIVLKGGIILYPTDTIWGIGCDATNQEAIQKLFKIKQRPDNKSLLVLMDGLKMLSVYLEYIPDSAREIINTAQKPTTIIYQKARNLAPNLLGEDGSVGIRITSDPFCKQLMGFTGKPIISTSANLSGKPTASSFFEIEEIIRDSVDFVVEWRQHETDPATPSSILKIGPKGKITVLRP